MKQMCPTRGRFEQQWQDSRVAEGIRAEIWNGVILQKGFVLQKLSTQLWPPLATSQRVKVNPRDTIVSLSTKTCDTQGAFLLLHWGLKVPSVTCQESKKAQFPLTLCNKVNVRTKILTSMFSPITNLDSNYALKLKIFFKIWPLLVSYSLTVDHSFALLTQQLYFKLNAVSRTVTLLSKLLCCLVLQK